MRIDDNTYQSPLSGRYAGKAMRELFSPRRRILEWRRLWIALAEAQQELGIAITDAQLDELRATRDDIDLVRAAEFELELRHDVMAHVHTWGEKAPSARGILHLGATSCYVTDNADLILMREAIDRLITPLVAIVDRLAEFARRWRSTSVVAYTHFQPAQLTTVGKRACLWMQDFVDDIHRLEQIRDTMRFRGVKGTTGTQASFLALFQRDHDRIEELDRRVSEKMGFPLRYAVCGQTYPRKLDHDVLSSVAGVAVSAGKFAVDIRLLSHERELEEPFESKQIGSSAMAYKRNPMRSERICALARFITSLVDNATQTAMNQWLERTLDDSANRRLSIPESFLAADGMLQTTLNVCSGLIVREAMIAAHVAQELPFQATEEILMASVQAGGDRQDLHEAIRQHSVAVAEQLKSGGANDLFERIAKDDRFSAVHDRLADLTRPERFHGRAPEQVDQFLANVVDPLLAARADRVQAIGEVRV